MLSECIDRITTSTGRPIARIFSEACVPSMRGIEMSMTTTCGSTSRTSSIASCPVAASPTTSMSLALSSSARTPRRTRWWSSTIITRIIGSPRPAARSQLDRSPASIQFAPNFLHVSEFVSSLNLYYTRLFHLLPQRPSEVTIGAIAVLLIPLPVSERTRSSRSTDRREQYSRMIRTSARIVPFDWLHDIISLTCVTIAQALPMEEENGGTDHQRV